MPRLVNDIGDIQDVKDEQVYEVLQRGYTFEDPQVMVKTIAQEGQEEVHNLGAAQARKLVLGGKVDYLSPEGFQGLKDKKKYGSGYEMEALGLSAANALTFGGFSEVAKRVGFPEVTPIEKYNPKISLGGDLITTGLAMGLAGTGVGAPLAAPILTKQALKMAARQGPAALTKLGLKSTAAGIKKAPWKFTGPGAVALLGKKGERAVAQRLLGEAAEEVLDKTVKRGLMSRMLTMGAEGAMFAGGYSLVDAVGHLYDGREPEQVATTFLQEVSTGMLIGAALPAVFHLPGVAGAKLFKGLSGMAQKGLNLGADTQISKDFFEKMVDAVAATDPERYATAEAKIDLAEQLRHTVNVDEATKLFNDLTTKKDNIITTIGEQLAEVINAQGLIRQVDQKGHNGQFILDALAELKAGESGAASTTILNELLLNGMSKFKKTNIQGGLLDTLEKQTLRAIQDGVVILEAKSGKKVVQNAPELTELKGILEEIRSIRELVHVNMDKMTRDPKFEELHAGWRTMQHEGGGGGYGLNPVERNEYWKRISSQLMSFPGSVGREHLNANHNAVVFTWLERLASRAHQGIKKGPFQDTDFHQAYMNEMKEQITSVLTNSSNRGWEIPRSLAGELEQLTPFGRMAHYKGELNTLMLNRDTQYELIQSKLFMPHPKYPGVTRIPDDVKIEDFVNNLDHRTSEQNMRLIQDFADNQSELMSKLSERYSLPVGVTRETLEEYVDHTITHRSKINDGVEFLTKKMKPALEYYGVLERERIAGLSGANPGMLPYAFGAGIGALFGGVPGAGAGLAGGAAFRFSQEMILNPGRAMAKLHTFFRTVNAYDDFINKQVDRYFNWINYAKKNPQTKRLEWSTDKHEKMRYSRLWTSNAMARLVTGGEFEGEAKSKSGTAYRKEELKNTVAISNAISKSPEMKEKIINAAVVNYQNVDPHLANALKEKVSNHIDGVEKLVADIKPRSQPPFGDLWDFEVDDTKAEEIGPVIQVMERGTPAVLTRLFDGTLTKRESDAFWEHHPQEAQKFTETLLGWLTKSENRESLSMLDESLMRMLIGIPPVEQGVAAVLAAAYTPDEKPGPQPRGQMKNLTSAETAMQQLEKRMG